LLGKPAVALLGKKCHREFEKRDDACPNCPGRAALETGRPHRAERFGVPDRGDPYKIITSAYPVFDPAGRSIGFVEVIEKLYELDQLEKYMLTVANLQSRMAEAATAAWVLRHALDAALSLDGLDAGCAYLATASDSWDMVSQRGFPREQAEQILRRLSIPRTQKRRSSLPQPCPFRTLEASGKGSAVVVPIVDYQHTTGALIVGSSSAVAIPSAILFALTSLGAVASLAASQLMARRPSVVG
jgi:PAS fold